MPKSDPKGVSPNPIRAKLAGDISRPLSVVAAEPVAMEPQPTSEPAKIMLVPTSEPNDEPRPSTKLAKPKKVLFTVAEQKENDAVIRHLAEAVGAETLGWSHVNRALWSLLRRAQDLIEARRPAAPQLVRPSNGNPMEMARFEDELSQYLLALFKDIPRQPWN